MNDLSGFNKLNVSNLSFKVSDMNLFGLGKKDEAKTEIQEP